MRFYLDVFKFNFLIELVYPFEVISFLLRKFAGLGFLALFWFVISKTNSDIFDFKKLIAYFLISNSVRDLSLSSGSWIGRDIQKTIGRGELSNYLIKPVDMLRFMLASFMGRHPTTLVYSIISIIVGVILSPPPSILNYLLFLITLIFAFCVSAGTNVLMGSIGFYSPQGGGIKNMYEHVSKLLSGTLIPLNYFPVGIRQFATFLPFPIVAYYPASLLQNGGLNSDTYLKLFLCAFWSFTLIIIANFVWKKSLKNYDGAGI